MMVGCASRPYGFGTVWTALFNRNGLWFKSYKIPFTQSFHRTRQILIKFWREQVVFHSKIFVFEFQNNSHIEKVNILTELTTRRDCEWITVNIWPCTHALYAFIQVPVLWVILTFEVFASSSSRGPLICQMLRLNPFPWWYGWRVM